MIHINNVNCTWFGEAEVEGDADAETCWSGLSLFFLVPLVRDAGPWPLLSKLGLMQGASNAHTLGLLLCPSSFCNFLPHKSNSKWKWKWKLKTEELELELEPTPTWSLYISKQWERGEKSFLKLKRDQVWKVRYDVYHIWEISKCQTKYELLLVLVL